MLIIHIGLLVVSWAIWSAILAPVLQFAFKLAEGERNEYRDAFGICFKANLISAIVAYILPLLLGESWIHDSLDPLLGLCLFTYFIAKELGDLKRSLLIALLLEGITFAFALTLLALLIGVLVVAS